MRYKVCSMVFFLICVLSLPAAWANGDSKTDAPEWINKTVPVYPGAIVTSVSSSENRDQVVLRVESSTLEKLTPKNLFDYYKKEMTDKGWKIRFERVDNARLVMVRGEKQFGFSANKDRDGKTVVFMLSMMSK